VLNYLYKILIIGATGFLGSSLLKELALSNYLLVALKKSLYKKIILISIKKDNNV